MKYFFPLFFVFFFGTVKAQDFKLTPSGYFKNNGVDVMAFDDIYPEGHQGGLSIIMHGDRVATNGDIRLEATPGQWQPLPKQGNRILDETTNTITTSLSYPDSGKHLTGFNPMIYPDLYLTYKVSVKGLGNTIIVTVDLDQPVPEKFLGKIGFNLELFPGDLFGKPWIMDNQTGIFPQHPNGPTEESISNIRFSAPDFGMNDAFKGKVADYQNLVGKGYNPIVADDVIAEPYAVGRSFTVRPDDAYSRFTITSETSDLKLYDGRMNHNNGWFVVRSEVPSGATTGAIRWVITPNIEKEWMYKPVIQISQVGYHPDQPKEAIIELDSRDNNIHKVHLQQITPEGVKDVKIDTPLKWGSFLRYNYLKFDFSGIQSEGLYRIVYGDSQSSIFRIAKNIYNRGVWQPVLEYFLPVQMCHMRVSEKYRVWHDHCHSDDARMAPNMNHIDGYVQQADNMTKYKAGDFVPGLNIGGWHDAGDFDLRIESQSGETYILAKTFEEFGVDYDVTTVDQLSGITEIHQPDGKNDLLQQVENGVLTIVAGYRALGRLYRGIICPDLRQYVLLGDASAMTDHIHGTSDDRWVFTEDNPVRALTTSAHLAAASRVLKGFNDTLSVQALQAAREIFAVTQIPEMQSERVLQMKLFSAAELFLTTNEEQYRNFLLDNMKTLVKNPGATYIGPLEKKLNNKTFSKQLRENLQDKYNQYAKQGEETPYGVPYRPNIWGAGWNIQSFGCNYYYYHKYFPEIFKPDYVYNALNFVLGCHPGKNTSSFASGVGAVSATVGYGLNRADWSYIPGGVISGTALIRPDFPELLVFPYLWQQVEYVLGGGSSNYMFLVLAAQHMLNK